jgi:hypothetical protein
VWVLGLGIRLADADKVATLDLHLSRRLYSDSIIHGLTEPLLATQILFRCLNRYMPEQKLNLLKFAPGIVAAPGT